VPLQPSPPNRGRAGGDMIQRIYGGGYDPSAESGSVHKSERLHRDGSICPLGSHSPAGSVVIGAGNSLWKTPVRGRRSGQLVVPGRVRIQRIY
jgi:hypothetical protein